jgi:hypothetical protein
MVATDVCSGNCLCFFIDKTSELYNKELLNKTESSEQKNYSSNYFKVQPVKEDWVQVATKNYMKNNSHYSEQI